MRIFELLKTKIDATEEELLEIKNWDSAIEDYETGNFIDAKSKFGVVKTSNFDIKRLFIDRCSDLIMKKPEFWDGVNNLTSK